MDEGEFEVCIELIDDYKFRATFCSPKIQDLVLDEPKPLGSGEYPNAGKLLAAAIGNCLCASLAFCLRKAKAEVKSLTGRVYTTMERNAKGRLRLTRIRVEIIPEVDSFEKLKHCADIFEDFCIVTQSVKNGIPIEVKFKASSDEGKNTH
ncbi:MAG: OsmC family protein [Methanomassiliicoccales archaeon]